MCRQEVVLTTMRKLIAIGVLTLSALIAAKSHSKAEPITDSGTLEDHNGYACFADLSSTEGKAATLQLFDYQDAWFLELSVANRASVYRRFFRTSGLLHKEAFQATFQRMTIGEQSFGVHEATLSELHLEDVDEKTAAQFRVYGYHNIARALEAMSDDVIEVPQLIRLENTANALYEFRTCSYAAMGLQKGALVEADYRTEYRLIFEEAFKNWIQSMSRAETCFAARFDGDAVKETINTAADVFYPGALSTQKRETYKADLNRMLSPARRSGIKQIRTDGCSLAGSLSKTSRVPVDRAIQSASELD